MTKHCGICNSVVPPKCKYCPRCHVHFYKDHETLAHVRALKAAWDPARKAFICYLTGLKLELKDGKSPAYHSFDHQIPRKPGTLRMAAAFANIMKSDLSEEEFWLAVKELANRFLTGEEFDRDVIKFDYWKRWVKGR